MIDLDNTLVDRAGAYRAWAERFVADRRNPANRRGGAASEVERLVEADSGGFATREQVAAQIIDQFRLDGVGVARMVEVLRAGIVGNLALVPGAVAALDNARASGWHIACVTNGSTVQQRRKINTVGLADHLDTVVISEAVGVRKPDARIFHIAAELAGLDLRGAWMIGDSAEADIAGAAASGVRSAWLRHGRAWSTAGVTPTISVDTFADAIRRIVARPSRSGGSRM